MAVSCAGWEVKFILLNEVCYIHLLKVYQQTAGKLRPNGKNE